MKKLAILGASGHGKVIADAALLAGWKEIIFFDDKWPMLTKISHWDVIGDSRSLIEQKGNYDGVIVGIGANSIRLEKIKNLLRANIPVVSIVHPAATISPYAFLAVGTVVLANAVVNIDARCGLGCIINTSASVDHDCMIGDGVHISPGAHLAGNVQIGNLSWIGIGASVRQKIVIGSEVIVGAGAAVVESIADNWTVVGVPAKLKLNK
ncbi:acetyltransferase [Legionella jamestowniensis]|uniref:Chloramphenicol acetyltransferase n=1 Tax=Legionella jamestowniensis TaxID=455 RepID=A0A0W0UGN3_9GAMM|nr:acetyltransferase [Legionella jamestowniensis]KTD06813.1 chloramphenicol acetyltransferase [Legionella jamestowniensis]SFL82844.1 transferase hexapeptide (six repeat-containing protein) [Legionella jamestowniensis DSM 19215]